MKSFLSKFLMAFLLVLTIPAITILLLYGTAKSLLQQEILSAGESNLTQFFIGLDLHLAEMTETCVRTYLGTPIKNIVYSSMDGNSPGTYEIYEAQQFLKQVPNSKYHDLFVYYISCDRMVSSRYGCLNRETYYQAYYENMINKEEFDRILEPEEQKFEPVLFAFPGERGQMLGISWRTNVDTAHSSQPQITIVAILRDSALEDILKGASYGQNGEILIFDRHKKMLLSTAGQEIDFNLEHYTEEGKMYRDSFGGESFMMLVRYSQVLDCYYAYAISERVFWEKSNLLRLIGMVGLVLCMSISALVAVAFSKSLYNPITAVLYKVKRDTNKVYDRKSGNEMEFLSTVIDDSFQKNKELRGRIRRKEHTEKEEFLLQCMNGTLKMYGTGEDVFAEHGLSLRSDDFSTALIRFESADTAVVKDIGLWKERQLLLTILENVYTELSEKEGLQGYLVSIESALFCLVINYDAVKPASAFEKGMEICRAGKRFLEEEFGIRFTMALGSVTSGLEGIRDSYRQALRAMEYRFVYGRGSIISYGDICNRKFCYRPIVEPELFQRILEDAAEDMVEEKLKSLVDRILEGRKPEEEALETLEYLRMDITNVMNRICLEASIDGKVREQQIAILLETETFADFSRSFGACIRNLRENTESRKQKNDICVRAKHYVEEHFADADLNVNALGEAMGLSPSYVSRLFREENGISILEHLNRMRIREARKLLRESTKSVEEIALTIGFINGRALIKAFKRYEGITPGAYRELVTAQTGL